MQKPLAIVVIGGLITSTLLTLVMLPALYPWFDDQEDEPVDFQKLATPMPEAFSEEDIY